MPKMTIKSINSQIKALEKKKAALEQAEKAGIAQLKAVVSKYTHIPQMNPWTGANASIPPGSGEAMGGLCGFPRRFRRSHRPKRPLIHRFGPFPRHSDALLPW